MALIDSPRLVDEDIREKRCLVHESRFTVPEVDREKDSMKFETRTCSNRGRWGGAGGIEVISWDGGPNCGVCFVCHPLGDVLTMNKPS